MKKIILSLGCVAILLSGCTTSTTERTEVNSQITNEKSESTEKQIASLDLVNKDFQEVMRIGNDLITELSNISSQNEYESLVKADGYVKEMKVYYSNLLKLCEEDAELNDMAFQIKVLEHSCPNPISGNDSTSINNQKLLYQLHLKQISSSFTYLSNYMDYLAGNASKPDSETYFKEVPEMPTPDTVMHEITYDSEKTDSGVKQYMYLIGDTEEDANMNYNAYIVALGICDELSVEITSDVVYVKKNGTMVSAMMAGTDSQKGRFMIVSFQE